MLFTNVVVITCAILARARYSFDDGIVGLACRSGELWARLHSRKHGADRNRGAFAPDSTGNNWYCNGETNTVTYPAYWFGSTTSGCGSGTAGLMQWTGSSVSPNNTLEYCNGSTWTSVGTASSLALSGLTAGVTSNLIDSGDYAQIWDWNSLAGTSALTLSTTSTSAASNAQTLLNVAISGLNSTTTQTTYGVQISNAHTGTGATNIGLYATATGGANNYAAIFYQGIVGIGTTSPAYNLDIYPSGTTANLSVRPQTWSTSSDYARIILGDTNHTITTTWSAGTQFNDANGIFLTGANVGINQTSASALLSLKSSAINTGGGLGLYANGSSNALAFLYEPSAGDGNLSLYYSGARKISLDANGNSFFNGGAVGIGTTSPAGQLDVESTGTYAGYFNNTATTTAVDGVYAATASTTTGAAVYAQISGTGNAGYAGYFANTATSGTNYAIFASNAAANGYAVYASNSNNSGVALWCSSNYPAGCGGNEGWYNTSDARLKAGIVTLPSSRGLDAVMKLRPVTYHWKDPKRDQGGHIGLIAQEVEPLYPELVGTGPEGMKSLSYADFVVPLIKAVQQ